MVLRFFRRIALTSIPVLTLALHACDGSGSDGTTATATDAGRELLESGTSDIGRNRSEGASDAGPYADAADADLGSPAVHFIGRFETTPDAGLKVGFPHAQIIARFMGPEVSATFADERAYTDYGSTRWEVLVDGVSRTVLSINRAQTSYTLAQRLGPGPHSVELVKLTEASIGISQFMGFEFPGGELLPPPPAATRHIEFLGDSASNGYGVDGVAPCAASGATANARRAYPALVAADLGADHHNLGASSKGLFWNYFRPDLEVYSVLYPRILPFTAGTWDFTHYSPDVVWMTLGGNDYSRPNEGDPAPPFAAFEAKYDELVTIIRTRRPDAHIICAVAPSLTDEYPAGYDAYTSVKTATTNVVAAHAGAGDDKIYAFEFTRSVPAVDLTACDGHPNAAKHRKMADEAIVFIKGKTGWL